MKSVRGRYLHIAMLSIHSDPLGELGKQDTGGMSIYIRELSQQLGEMGHKVDIYTRSIGKRHVDTIQLENNVRVIYLNVPGSQNSSKKMLCRYVPDLWSSLEMYRMRNSLCYDLVHSHYWYSGQVGNMAKKHWDVPHFLTYHTTGIVKKISCFHEHEPKDRLVAEKRLARMCDYIITSTAREKQYLEKYLKADKEKIRMVSCGVNLKRFKPVDQHRARTELDLPRDKAILLYAGRFAPVKGIERLLYAMGHLCKELDIRLVVVGGDGKNSSSAASIKRLAGKLGLEDVLLLKGRVAHDELPLYYSAADLLVLPSFYESFGLVALESLACGTPVVSSNVGAMDKIIQNGLTGAVVNHPSPYLFAKKIREYISKTAILKKGNTVRRSISNFTWKSSSLKLIEEYQNAVSERIACSQNMLVS